MVVPKGSVVLEERKVNKNQLNFITTSDGLWFSLHGWKIFDNSDDF